MLLVSLALAGTAAVWANRWMGQQLAGAAGDADLSRVVAAAVELPFGTKLDASHVRLVELPPESVPEGAYTDIDETIGLIAVEKVYKGEVLIAGRVVEHLAGSALAAAVETGMRAITVRVDDVVGVAGFLLPGNRVDVIATRRLGSDGAESRTLIQNLRVLAVDQKTSPERDAPVVVRAVTLEATPREAEEIVRATNEGKVQLALRNPLEGVTAVPEPEPDAVAPEAVASDPVPVAPPLIARTLTVNVIRGTDVSSLTFDGDRR